MRKMFSENQIKAIAQEASPELYSYSGSIGCSEDEVYISISGISNISLTASNFFEVINELLGSMSIIEKSNDGFAIGINNFDSAGVDQYTIIKTNLSSGEVETLEL